jgi:hypothetical protein
MDLDEREERPSEMYIPGLTERVDKLERMIQNNLLSMENVAKEVGKEDQKSFMQAGWMR